MYSNTSRTHANLAWNEMRWNGCMDNVIEFKDDDDRRPTTDNRMGTQSVGVIDCDVLCVLFLRFLPYRQRDNEA